MMEKELSVKQRMAIERTTMPEQPPAVRADNFEEVNLGLASAAAVMEARRCIQCKTRPCVQGCPVALRIPEFLASLAAGDISAAAEILRRDNALPATTGRVCPQEKQCEALCVRCKKDQPVAIGWLERFVADWAEENSGQPSRPVGQVGDRGHRAQAQDLRATAAELLLEAGPGPAQRHGVQQLDRPPVRPQRAGDVGQPEGRHTQTRVAAVTTGRTGEEDTHRGSPYQVMSITHCLTSSTR